MDFFSLIFCDAFILSKETLQNLDDVMKAEEGRK